MDILSYPKRKSFHIQKDILSYPWTISLRYPQLGISQDISRYNRISPDIFLGRPPRWRQQESSLTMTAEIASGLLWESQHPLVSAQCSKPEGCLLHYWEADLHLSILWHCSWSSAVWWAQYNFVSGSLAGLPTLAVEIGWVIQQFTQWQSCSPYWHPSCLWHILLSSEKKVALLLPGVLSCPPPCFQSMQVLCGCFFVQTDLIPICLAVPALVKGNN